MTRNINSLTVKSMAKTTSVATLIKPSPNEEKCEITDDYACNKKYWKKSTNKGKDKKSKKTIEEEKDYCECMGLDYYEPDDFVLTQLRGAVKDQSS